jgi:hypothetical protein
MARQTNWLDSWDPYDFKGLRKSDFNEKKIGIKEFLKKKLKASDKRTGENHSIVLKWRKLAAGPATYRLVANITPPEKRDNGGQDSVISPKVPPQP